jgi:hypothetical protein
MTAAARIGPEAVAAPAAPPRGWIQSPAFDLAMFTLAPLAGLTVVLADQLPGGYRLGVAAMFLVAIPHYMSSFTFYLGDDNLQYFRTRRAAFFVGPAVIFAAVLFLRALGHAGPVLVAMFVWNVWHVSLQSAGILTIYRRLNAGPLGERGAAHLAILSVSATMTFWHVDRFEPLYRPLAAVHPLVPWLLPAAALPVAAASVGVLAWRIARRPHPISVAEGSFLLTSLLLFHPYLWVEDSNQATFAMLMGHFIQYLAIVWLLNHRKYAGSRGSRREQALAWISARPVPLFGTLFLVGTCFYVADRGSAALGANGLYVIVWNALTLVHFYIDGLVWAFRTPHVRDTVGPYLMPASRIAA